jgi:hypothetical protein
MFSIPLETAIVNSIVGNAVLAMIFFYLWRADRREAALGYWAAAYGASALRVMPPVTAEAFAALLKKGKR